MFQALQRTGMRTSDSDISVLNYIVHHADFRDVPKILETPYIPSVENPKKSYAPYKYEIEMLRAGKFDPDMKERIVKEHEKSV